MNQGGFRGYDMEKENPPFFFFGMLSLKGMSTASSKASLGWGGLLTVQPQERRLHRYLGVVYGPRVRERAQISPGAPGHSSPNAD